MRTEKKKLPGSLCIILGGILWGCIGLFTRPMYAAGLSVFNTIALRNVGAMIGLTLIFAITDRSVFKIRLKHLPIFFGTGIISILLFTLCYFACQRICSLAVSGILLYTAPAFVMLMSALLWREKIGGRKLAALTLAIIGCVLVSDPLGAGRISGTGLLLGLGSGFFYATYSIFGRYALKHYSSYTVTLWTFIFAGLGSLFFADGEIFSVFGSLSLTAETLGLVLLSTVAPYILYTRGLEHTESSKASIMASVEPVTAAVAGVTVFSEKMTLFTAAGIICVLLGVFLLAGEKRKVLC